MADDENPDEQAVEDFWYDLLAHIDDRKLIPITGPDLNVVTSDHNTLTGLIASRLVDRCGLKPTGHMTMRQAAGASIRKNQGQADRLYGMVNEVIREFEAQECAPLTKLAAVTDLRLFVSTTPDRLLARAIEKVRGGGVREVSFFPAQSTDERALNVKAPKESDTTIVRLFGQAASTAQYAIHDEDFLEWLHSLGTSAEGLPEWIAYPLKHQPLLMIGCDMPDWLGRFFLRLHNRRRMSSSESKQFFLVNTPGTPEPPLAEFLATYCPPTKVRRLNMAADAFVKELHSRWARRLPRPSRTPPISTMRHASSPRPTVFLSYLHEDFKVVRRLYGQADEICGDVWFDKERLEPGYEWSEQVEDAIKRCQLFLPIISANIDKATEGYFFRELGLAIERQKSMPPGRRFILPVIIDDPSRSPECYCQMPTKLLDFTFGYAPNGDLDPRLHETLEHEVRAIRRPGAA